MTLDDDLRQCTFQIRDVLGAVERRYQDLVNQRLAEEDRANRAKTLAGQSRERERYGKQEVSAVDHELQELERRLDEIEKQRQQLLDESWKRREGKVKLEQKVVMASEEAKRAQATVEEAQKSRERIEHSLSDVEGEIERHRTALRRECVRALERYVSELARSLDSEFRRQQEVEQRLASAEAFRRARHEDPAIGDLCDQRDQLVEFINKATVPGVARALRTALEQIEADIERRYPGALKTDSSPQLAPMVELHYFPGRDGGARILLPISQTTWDAMRDGDTTGAPANAMSFLWHMIRGLGLKPSDGEFGVESGFRTFTAAFGSDDVPALGRFTVRIPPSGEVTFTLKPLPDEVNEGLAYEDP